MNMKKVENLSCSEVMKVILFFSNCIFAYENMECDFTYKSGQKEMYYSHLYNVHDHGQVYVCRFFTAVTPKGARLCKKAFPTSQSLNKHKTQYHNTFATRYIKPPTAHLRCGCQCYVRKTAQNFAEHVKYTHLNGTERKFHLNSSLPPT